MRDDAEEGVHRFEGGAWGGLVSGCGVACGENGYGGRFGGYGLPLVSGTKNQTNTNMAKQKEPKMMYVP
jgi:hypothetical protein